VKRMVRIVALLLLAEVTSACVHVAPWERGRLGKPHMALEPTPIQRALRSHVYASREAAAAGWTHQGGGCGCY
jgi:hypothetical protein